MSNVKYTVTYNFKLRFLETKIIIDKISQFKFLVNLLIFYLQSFTVFKK